MQYTVEKYMTKMLIMTLLGNGCVLSFEVLAIIKLVPNWILILIPATYVICVTLQCETNHILPKLYCLLHHL